MFKAENVFHVLLSRNISKTYFKQYNRVVKSAWGVHSNTRNFYQYADKYLSDTFGRRYNVFISVSYLSA